MLTQSFVREHFNYDEDTGILSWIKKSSPYSRVKIGEPVGCKHRSGYIVLTIKNRQWLAHQIAFLYMEGYIPEEIDHEDTDKTNNAWNNLRPSDRSGNQQNKNISSNNTSGVKGVTWNKQRKKWQASIKFKGKSYHLGLHESLDRAKQVLDEKRLELHGAFSNFG